ncbi:zinc ribbon domain-containing protein [Streptomyces sp. NPDC050619]|uniref:zinc ribbon domain-containing protein n=1 Tax=Streptomyces sp. NPDC050619 TaxID=3157214 RepID=UPI00342EE8EA
MRACPACGASNGSTDDFCGNCGAYLGWSDPTPAPNAPSEPTSEPDATQPPSPPGPEPTEPPLPSTPPDATPAPSSPPADEPTPPRTSSLRDRLTGRGRGGAREPSAPPAAGSRSDAEPGRDEAVSPPSKPGPDDGRTEAPAPVLRSTTGETTGDEGPPTTEPPARPESASAASAASAASGTAARPSQPPAKQSSAGTPPAPTAPNMPGPRPPTTPTPEAPPPDPVLPVRPAKPVAQRPVVRPVEVPDEAAGVPCPSCGALNQPDRRFCRRCATPLNPAPKPDPLPWWRTVWPFRRRVRASSGRAVRLLVILAVVVALCAGAILLLPAGRDLYEDTLDKLGKPKAVTPVDIEASAEIPRHPATNTTDEVSNSYWGAPEPGASVTYTFRKPFRLVDMLITNGPSKNPEAYTREARALQIDLEVTTSDGTRHDERLTLSDKPGSQPTVTGISDVKTVRLVLRSPVGLTPGRHLALAEVEFFQRG